MKNPEKFKPKIEKPLEEEAEERGREEEVVAKEETEELKENREGAEETFEEKPEEKVFTSLGKQLGAEKGIVTDRELVELTKKVAQESGIKEDVFEVPENRPLVFYRAMRDTEAVRDLLKKNEITTRPFSFAKPGKWSEKLTDIPLSYGGESPRLVRIIDTAGEWDDTAPYIGFGPKGSWKEAINLDKVVLRKIDERTIEVKDAYKQVGAEVEVPEEKLLQTTFIVDKIKTKEAKASKTLEEFINDAGFWREIGKSAKRFVPREGEYPERINRKYLEYFNQTLELDETKAETKEAKERLRKAKTEIQKLIKKVMEAKEDDPVWTPKARLKTLEAFPEETLAKISGIKENLELEKAREEAEKTFGEEEPEKGGEKEEQREDIEGREEKEIQTIEKSPLETGKKLDLALLALERKKVAYLGDHKIAETEKEKKEIVEKFTKELEEIKETLDQLGLPYQTTKALRIEDEAIVGFSVSVGRNEEDLSKFIEAEKEGDDREMGFLLGYPKTAVETYNTDKALNFEVFFQQELSEKEQEELREEGVLKFLGFQPSKEHWREELEQAKEDQRLIKEKAPRLYQEIMESEDPF